MSPQISFRLRTIQVKRFQKENLVAKFLLLLPESSMVVGRLTTKRDFTTTEKKTWRSMHCFFLGGGVFPQENVCVFELPRPDFLHFHFLTKHFTSTLTYSPSLIARIDSSVVSAIYAMVARTNAGKYPVMPLKNEPANNIYRGRSKYITSNVSDISTAAPKQGKQMAGLRPTLSDHEPINSPMIRDGAPAKKINPNM